MRKDVKRCLIICSISNGSTRLYC